MEAGFQTGPRMPWMSDIRRLRTFCVACDRMVNWPRTLENAENKGMAEKLAKFQKDMT